METLTNLAKTASPNEAVGLILPDESVIPLPNRSPTPRNSFQFGVDDIRLSLENAGVTLTEADWWMVVLWHTHPSGGVGPSRLDMKHKVPRLTHLVLTLDGDDVIPSWY